MDLEEEEEVEGGDEAEVALAIDEDEVLPDVTAVFVLIMVVSACFY